MEKSRKRRRRKTEEPPGLAAYCVAVVAAGLFGGVISFGLVCWLHGGWPKEGPFTNLWLAPLPGAVAGALLGLFFPKTFATACSLIFTNIKIRLAGRWFSSRG